MEEMGDWAKVLEVIDLETSDAAASGAVDDAEMQQPDDSLLFVKNDKWDGPQFLRYLPTPSILRSCIRAAVNTNLEVLPSTPEEYILQNGIGKFQCTSSVPQLSRS